MQALEWDLAPVHLRDGRRRLQLRFAEGDECYVPSASLSEFVRGENATLRAYQRELQRFQGELSGGEAAEITAGADTVVSAPQVRARRARQFFRW